MPLYNNCSLCLVLPPNRCGRQPSQHCWLEDLPKTYSASRHCFEDLHIQRGERDSSPKKYTQTHTNSHTRNRLLHFSAHHEAKLFATSSPSHTFSNHHFDSKFPQNRGPNAKQQHVPLDTPYLPFVLYCVSSVAYFVCNPICNVCSGRLPGAWLARVGFFVAGGP